MNKLQENKLRMYVLIEKVCNENAAIWNEFQPFANTVEKFNKHVDLINKARQRQEQNNTGVKDDKDTVYEKLVNMALKHVSALKVYAVLGNSRQLLKKISFTKSTFERARATEIIDKCQLVYNESVANIEQLAVYSITETEIQDFERLIKQYQNIFTETSESRNERLLATQKLKELIKETDFILKTQLDNLIYFYKETNPEFYNLYKKSRRIIKYGVRYENEAQEQGSVTLTTQTSAQSKAA